MNWTVSGDTVHVTIPHGTVVFTEDQLKAMWNALQDQRPLCQFCLDRLPRTPSCDKLDCDRRTRKIP